MIPDNYEIPTAIERASANVQFSLINEGEYLDKGFWARTRSRAGEKEESGNRVVVLGFPGSGLSIINWYDDPDSFVGVAASRKILDS